MASGNNVIRLWRKAAFRQRPAVAFHALSSDSHFGTAQVGNAQQPLAMRCSVGQPANGVIVDSHEAGLQTGDGAVDQNIGRFALLYSFEKYSDGLVLARKR